MNRVDRVNRGGEQIIPRPESARSGAPNPWLGADFERLNHDRVRAVIAQLDGRHLPDDLPTTPMRPPFVTTTRESAVLLPLFLGADGELRVVLTRRSGRLNTHKGEVAFPGGRVDPGETNRDAALREAHEEIGLAPMHVEIVGTLEPLTTVVSASRITPFVGIVGSLPELTANPTEVARIFDVSLRELTNHDCYHEEIWDFADGTFPVWFFEVEGDTIWGATARMLRRLLDLLLLD
jgi:8-oxo-dGTP pyrophosphatase MutT (NUDIX family)